MSDVILLAAAGMVLFGLSDFFLKKGLSLESNTDRLLFYCLLVAAFPFGILSVIHSVPLNLEGPLLYYSLSIGLLFFAATVSLTTSLKHGEASIVIPIVRMGFVITALCAFIFLSEPITLTKGLGLIAAIVAIFLLSTE